MLGPSHAPASPLAPASYCWRQGEDRSVEGGCPVMGKSPGDGSTCNPWQPLSNTARKAGVLFQDGLHLIPLIMSAGRCHSSTGLFSIPAQWQDGQFPLRGQKTTEVGRKMASERCPHPNPQYLCTCHLTWKREISGEIKLRILRWGLAILDYPCRPRWAEEGGRRLRGRVTQREGDLRGHCGLWDGREPWSTKYGQPPDAGKRKERDSS